jgi:hypothetical protein
VSNDSIIAVSTAFAAVGTVAALSIAVYRDVFREWRLRPKLRIAFDAGGRHENLDLVTVGSPDEIVRSGLRRRSTNVPCRGREFDGETRIGPKAANTSRAISSALATRSRSSSRSVRESIPR